MTPAELKYNVEQTGSCFFTRSSMKFFGDTMANYGCRSSTHNGQEVWELWRKRPVKCGLTNSAYFSKTDFSRIH